MFLLATNKRDITTDFIVSELKSRSLPFLRLNTEDLAGAAVTFRALDGGDWLYTIEGNTVALNAVGAGYYRRPAAPVPPAAAQDRAVQAYCVDEWSAILRSLWNALDGRWLNSPFSILRAEDKPRQLREASMLGLRVPETVVTNCFETARKMVAAGDVVGKPLRHALVENADFGTVLFTSKLDYLQELDRQAVQLAPVIYQREIEKACDVRVTVVGDRLFPVAIKSQAFPETSVDWRKGSRPDLAHEVIELPLDVQELCVALTRRLDLSFGAIDLILDREGRYWFLEINPNGQWAWIERRTGLRIASAIVDKMLEIAA